MRWTRKSSGAAEITPTQCRDEIISILAAGLVRIVRGSEAAPGTSATNPASIPGHAWVGMHDEKLSESGEIGLELSGETRLSVVAG